MSTDDDKPPTDGSGQPGDGDGQWDRMSLNSLRRELEVQKNKTAEARDDAQDRIEERASKKTPWAKIALYVGIGVVLFLGILFAVRSALPESEQWSLPEFIQTPHDAGSLADYLDEHPALEIDAGPRRIPDAGPARHHGHGHRRRDAGPGAAPAGRPDSLDFGDGVDPLGGVLGEN